MTYYIEAGLIIAFFLGYLIGRHNQNNSVEIRQTMDNAIKWIASSGGTMKEQQRMVNFLIWLTDDGEERE
jgi:hypothetical protein